MTNRLFAVCLSATLLAVSGCADAPAARVAALLQKMMGAGVEAEITLSGCQFDISTTRALPESGPLGPRIQQAVMRYDLRLYAMRKANIRKTGTFAQLTYQPLPVWGAMLDQAEIFMASVASPHAADTFDRESIRKLLAQPGARLTQTMMVIIPSDGGAVTLDPDGPAFHREIERLREAPAPFSVAFTADWLDRDGAPSPKTLLLGSALFPPPLAFGSPSEDDVKALFNALGEHVAAECPIALR
ncbi:MAG: hypothetical protein ACJA1L_000522 [Paracoccaceae bacterium]|jgi:hypothetical protein